MYCYGSSNARKTLYANLKLFYDSRSESISSGPLAALFFVELQESDGQADDGN